MRTVVLIKQHPTIQLGHLYEHLFLRCLNNFFYEQGLFKYLDYAAYGTTYDRSGIILAMCELFSEEAVKLQHQIDTLAIDLGEENSYVSTALHQISAEEQEKLHITDKEKVLLGLKKLDASAWEHIDAITLLDTKKIRRKYAPIYLTNRKQKKPRKLRLTVRLDKDFATTHRELLPLFVIVGRIILLTTGNRVTAAHGAYAGELCSEQSFVTSNLYITTQAYSLTTPESILQTIKATLEYMLHEKTYARTATYLSSATYDTTPELTPNTEGLLGETGILIGSKGWHRTASVENIKDILNHSIMEVRFSHKRDTWQTLQLTDGRPVKTTLA